LDRIPNNRSIPKPSHQRSIESTTIDQTQPNRSIIPTGHKDTPQHRSIEPQTLGLLAFEAQPNLRGEISLERDVDLECMNGQTKG
jgi:hypothetical protein